MNISVILAHPSITSFNHAIADTVAGALHESGHRVRLHDLYEEGFNPLIEVSELPKGAVVPPDVEAHCSEIASADGIVIVHPNWWGQPPAILKGWVDRVLRPGVAYEFLEGDSGEGVPRGLLKARAALVFNTSNTLPDREKAVFGDPLETIWKNCIFGLCGINEFRRRTYGVIVTSSLDQRRGWLEDAAQLTRDTFPPL